jgi:hypothetical protein
MHSNQIPNYPLVKFLRFKEFHLAPLNDVTPDAIKSAARDAISKFRDTEELKLNTALNHIARSLGFNAGFASFKSEFDNGLLNFMRQHGLKQRADLIRPQFDMPFVSLTPRQMADRLFFSDQPWPDRIFTGYNLDGFSLNDRYFRQNIWQKHPGFEMFTLPYDLVMREMVDAESKSPGTGTVALEAAVAACQFTIQNSTSNAR